MIAIACRVGKGARHAVPLLSGLLPRVRLGTGCGRERHERVFIVLAQNDDGASEVVALAVDLLGDVDTPCAPTKFRLRGNRGARCPHSISFFVLLPSVEIFAHIALA
jgi:hypothetical protein